MREGGRLVEPLDATTMPQSVHAEARRPVGPIAAAGSLDLAPDLDLDLDLDLDGRTSSETAPGALEVTRPFTTGAAIADDAPFSIDLPGLPASRKRGVRPSRRLRARWTSTWAN